MTDLAYMLRDDWGQHGTAMVSSSARIREWLDSRTVLFAVTDKRKLDDAHSADLEAAEYIVAGQVRNVVDIADLKHLAGDSQVIAVLHPFEERDCQTLIDMVRSATVERVFVLVWSPGDIIRRWLDALGAVDLHTGTPLSAPDPLQVAAGALMVDVQYNGLGSGLGKDTVVELLQAFTREGYPLDEDAWLRAFFAAGGDFRHAKSVAKFVKEMKAGTKHRFTPRFGDGIVDILRRQLAES